MKELETSIDLFDSRTKTNTFWSRLTLSLLDLLIILSIKPQSAIFVSITPQSAIFVSQIMNQIYNKKNTFY